MPINNVCNANHVLVPVKLKQSRLSALLLQESKRGKTWGRQVAWTACVPSGCTTLTTGMLLKRWVFCCGEDALHEYGRPPSPTAHGVHSFMQVQSRCSSHLRCAREGSKAAALYDLHGLVGCSCAHGFAMPNFFCNMDRPENFTFYLVNKTIFLILQLSNCS